MTKALTLVCALSLAACAGAPPIPTVTVHPLCPPSGGEGCVGSVDKLEVPDQDFTSFNPTVTMHLGNDAPVELTEATWEVQVGNEITGSGKTALARTLKPGEALELKAPSIPYASAEKLGEILDKEGALGIVMRGQVHTTGGQAYEFSRAGDVRTPRVPKTRMWHIEVSSYPDESKIGVIFFIRVVNKNPFEIQVDELNYNLAVGGKKLITDGVAGSHEKIPASTGGQIEIAVELNKQNFPDVAHYMRNWSGLPYELGGDVHLAVGHIPITLTGHVGDSGDQLDEEESKDTNTLPTEDKDKPAEDKGSDDAN